MGWLGPLVTSLFQRGSAFDGIAIDCDNPTSPVPFRPTDKFAAFPATA
jgi:hypothetical protein